MGKGKTKDPKIIEISIPKIDYPLPDVDGEKVNLCIPLDWLPFFVQSLNETTRKYLHNGGQALYLENLAKINAVLDGLLNNCGNGQAGCEEETCNEYQTDSYIITYAPNDPYQTPDHEPAGYYSPPWQKQEEAPFILSGLQAGDVLMGIWSVQPDNLLEYLEFSFFLTNIIQAAQFVLSGFPRFNVKMNGEGTARLYLLSVPFGGQALISVDGFPVQVVDLYTLNPASIAEFNDWIELVMGVFFSEDDLVQEVIVELEINGAGEHDIDVTLIPMVGAGDVGWGGGLRKIVLCNEELVGVSNQMPQFRVNQETLQIEWKPNAITPEWAGIGQVIYPITMQTDPTNTDLIQYTLQPIPIGGGADPFQQWVNLLEVNTNTLGIAGANATTLDAGEPATASIDSNRILQLGIPAGQDGTDGASPELRVSGGFIQWKLETSGTWNNLIAVADLEGQDCDCAPPAPPYNGDPEQTADEEKCAIATGLIEWLFATYLDTVNDADAAVDLVAAIDVIFYALGPLGFLADQVVDVVAEIKNAGSSLIIAAMDTATKEDMQEWLYCRLQSGEFNESVVEDLKNEGSEFVLPAARPAWQGFLSLLLYSTYEQRAKIASYGQGNCVGFECPDPEWTWNWDYQADGQPDIAVVQLVKGTWGNNRFGTYNSHMEICYAEPVGAGQYEQAANKITLQIPVNEAAITSVKFTIDGVEGGMGTVRRAKILADGVAIRELDPAYTGLIDWTGTANPSNLTFELIWGANDTCSGLSLPVHMVSIEISGTGTNPFV